MELTGWTIDRCGHLRDATVSGIGPHVTVLVGPNEVGKTTTHHFLRWVLLGFPSANTSVFRRYKPDGGAISGRIRLRHDGRDLVLERSSAGGGGARLWNDDGSPAAGVGLADLVGTTTPELYRSIFAVGIDELREVSALDRDEVREHLFAAGLVGAGRSASAALRDLDAARDPLLSARKGHLRDLARELADARAALAAARSRVTHLGAARAEADRLEAEAAATFTELDAARADAAFFDGLVESWPGWSRRGPAAREVADLPDLDLGPDPVGRIDRLLERRADAARSCTELERDHAALVDELGSCRPDRDLLGAGPRVRAGLAGAQADRAGARELAQARSRLAQDQRAAERAVAELGPGWDPDLVLASPWTAATAGEVEESGRALRDAEEAARAARRSLAEARELATLAERRWDEYAATANRAGGTGPGPDDGPSAPSRIPAVPVALAAAAIGLVVMGAGFLAAGGSLALGIVTLAGAVALAAVAGVVAVRTLVDRAASDGRDRSWLERLRAEVEAHRGAADAARRRDEQATADVAAARQDWTDRLRACGLPADLSPGAAPALVRDVLAVRDRLRRLVEERTRLARDAATLQASVAGWVDLLRAFGVEVDPHDHDAVVRALDDLAGRCRSAEDAAIRHQELTRRLQDVDARRLCATEELAARQAELAARLDAAGVDDVEAYRRLVALADRRADLLGVVEEAERCVVERFGAGEVAERARKELALGRVEDWSAAATAARERVGRLGERHQELHRAAARARQSVDDVERSADVAAGEMDVDRLTNELADAARDWVRLTLARDAVSATLERFERDRQPEVVDRAASSLSRVTGTRWERVVTGERGLEVLSPAGVRLTDASLSRGTAEQLYLCMRLALARTHAGRTARLPVLLDDVLVNADDDRVPLLAAEVADAAEDLQVLVFTARRATADALVVARADTRVVELVAPAT